MAFNNFWTLNYLNIQIYRNFVPAQMWLFKSAIE